MDFKNLCQNIDVDSIRARIPALPLSMPSLPQIKFPKSMPKLRSRRIFKSSREDVTKVSPKQQQLQSAAAPPPPLSEFINHSPRRISTISSLMYQNSDKRHSTYRSAHSIDDDYPSPRQNSRHASRPISPNASVDTPRAGGSGNNATKMSLTEKLQKGYKDLSEFRLKHIFAKKTVVRKDNIEVDQYVRSFEDDRRRQQEQQEKRDQQIADNYRFKFKVSRQNTGHSDSISSHGSAAKPQAGTAGKSVSDDESGMEDTPPKRKAGIAATRFAKVRNPPLQHPAMSEDSNAGGVDEDEDLGDYGMPADMEPNPSALWEIKESKNSAEASPIAAGKKDEKASASSKNVGYKERLKRLKSFVSSQEEAGNESAPENSSAGAKVMSKLLDFGNKGNDPKAETTAGVERKRKAPLTPQQSEEQEEGKAVATDNPLNAIKQNIKRFQKSIKRQHVSTANESEDEEAPTKEVKSTTKTEKLAARLRRFKSREASLDEIDDSMEKQEEASKSPMRSAIGNKLQNWTKSFKKKAPQTQADTNTGDESSPEKQKRSDTLMQKLKYIRERKNPNSGDDLDADDGEEAANKSKEPAGHKSSNLEERFEQARQKTIKKVNEKMQQIKFFHKSQENIDKETAKKTNKSGAAEEKEDSDDEGEADAANIRPKIARRRVQNDYDSEQDDIEEIANVQPNYLSQKTRAVWTTRNILSDSIDSETDGEFPRVLIHQDNSDVFESTLIIAVTRPALPSPTPKITEITAEKRTPSPRPVDWIPNKEVVSSFLEITPPPRQRRSSAELAVPAKIQGHVRKLSMDSNSDSDSWIPESVRSKQLSRSKDSSRRASTAGLISIDESEEPWKVHSMYREERLHKARSIDIFEANKQKGGVSGAFEDFDDELKNAPVVRISQRNADSFERESSEDLDAPDDDNSSRITKILNETKTVEERATPRETVPVKIEVTPATADDAKEHIKQIGNSCESLEANYDESEEMYTDDEDDLPPNEAPPPPPPNMSPPPPPLPQRQPSIRLPKEITQAPPPLPVTKPPLPATKPPLPATKPPLPPSKPPPNIPERTASMSRLAKPLVKTSSLRLAYNEQVKPADVGKVNKLISRFEQPQGKITERPRIIPRHTMLYDSDDYSDDEDDEEDSDDALDEDNNVKFERDATPTPTNTPRTSSVDSEESLTTTKDETQAVRLAERAVKHERSATRDEEQNTTLSAKAKPKSPAHIPKLMLNVDLNSNCSRPSSEYGSPLEYPSSLIGSTETTPIPDRRQQDIRSRRSMTRDDDNFQSFDSDEENSYYSISSSGSNRYIVEI